MVGPRPGVTIGAVDRRVVTADRGDAGQRLDLVLRRHLSDVASATRTRIQTWIESGRVTINGTRCAGSRRAPPPAMWSV